MDSSRTRPDVVVMGASAGGVEALAAVVEGLAADLAAAVFVVLHVSSTSVLPAILARRCRLPVETALDGAEIREGTVYVAPPGRHLLVGDGRVVLSDGPRENRHRPAIDVLFRSAAEAYGPRVVGVILSGALDDGTAGLRRIKARGGLALVQDPEEAMHSGMPASAVAHVAVDRILRLAEIPEAITDLVMQDGHAGEELVAMSEAVRSQGPTEPAGAVPPDPDTRMYACPECGGVLQETEEIGLARFLCHTGHVYSPESLLAAHADTVEGAMWSAVRSLKERAALLRRTRQRFSPEQRTSRQNLESQALEAEHQAHVIRDAILRLRLPAEESVDA